MKLLLCFLCACLLSHTATAQDPSPRPRTVSDTNRPSRLARVVLKFAPFTLLELQNTAEVAIELPLRDRFSLQAQVGYAPNWLAASLREGTSTYENYTQREYWRVRMEPRWYVGKNRRGVANQFPLGRYVAIDLLYKQLNASAPALIGHQCSPVNCASYDGLHQRVARYAVALGVKLGWQTALGHRSGSSQSRWLLDWYVGAGLRYAWSEFAMPPLAPGDKFEGSNYRGWLDPFKAGNMLRPNLLLGIKIGYTL